MVCALLISVVLAAGPMGPGQPLIVDGVVAIVDDVPILVSDLRLAWAVRLVEPKPGEDLHELGRRVLDARISLEVQHADLGLQRRGFHLTERVASVVDRLYEAGGGRNALLAELSRWGLDDDDVRELAVRLAEVEAYVQQDLRPEVRPSLDDVRTVYEREVVAPTRRAGHEPPPFESMVGELSRLVRERQLNIRLESWIAEARRRHTVVRYRDWTPEAGAPSSP